MKLSKSFSLSELTKSATATRHGFQEQFKPNREVMTNLSLLCMNALQPTRDFLGSPIRITSGYRCPRLNTKVGGSKTSQHVDGLAADIEGWDESHMVNIKLIKVGDNQHITLCDKIDDSTYLVYVNSAILLYAAFNLEGQFDQLISEYGAVNNCSWVHISVPLLDKPARGQILRKESGKRYVSMTKMDLFRSITSS